MKKSEALQIIADEIAQCTLCDELVKLRQENNYKTVPGRGNPNANVFVLGEAPGQNEAENGVPFIGKAGQLLDKMVIEAGWNPSNIYVANILKCKPPHNRDPKPEEAKNCRKFLDLQIKCIDPEWIVCFGRVATVYLMGLDEKAKIGALRGNIYKFQGRKIIATYHPSYLLRNPSAKSEVIKDMKLLGSDKSPIEILSKES